jgi:hypothetical protein
MTTRGTPAAALALRMDTSSLLGRDRVPELL